MGAGGVGAAGPFELSPAAKPQLVQDRWDDIAANPEDLTVSESQIRELDERRENLQRNPGSALSWEDVQRRARARYGR